jgi:hypothetical protein
VIDRYIGRNVSATPCINQESAQTISDQRVTGSLQNKSVYVIEIKQLAGCARNEKSAFRRFWLQLSMKWRLPQACGKVKGVVGSSDFDM